MTLAPEPLRLLFVSHTFPSPSSPLSSVGGMQRVATELHAALAALPEVALHSSLLRSSWRWIYLRAPFHLAGAACLAERLARRGELDAVLFSSVLSAAFVLPLTRELNKSRIKTVAIAHGDDVVSPAPGYQRLVRRGLQLLDSVSAVSRSTGSACLERGLEAQRLRVIPNGVDPGRFRPLADRGTCRSRLIASLGLPPLPADAFLLCSVGRLVARKGFAWFVRQVMPLLPAACHYWVAGDGPEARKVLAAAAAQGLAGRVRLLRGVREDALCQLYQSADLFVMPNIQVPGTVEGFGVVLLEAGLCGLPALAAELEGIRDVVADGESGVLVASGNALAFARAICRLRSDRPSLARLASAARFRAQQYSWPLIARQQVELLLQLTGGSPAGCSSGPLADRTPRRPIRRVSGARST